MAPLYLDESFSDSDDDSCIEQQQPQEEASKATNDREKSDDAFAYYSNDEIRMKTLKLQECDIDSTIPAMPSRQERKTRLSFELDPYLILEDELEELYGNDGDEEEYAFRNVDLSHLKNGRNNTKVDLLAELLCM